MRAGVLLRAFEKVVYERFIKFDSFEPGSAFRRQVAEFSPTGSVPFLIYDTVTDPGANRWLFGTHWRL